MPLGRGATHPKKCVMVALNQGPLTAPFLLSHKGTFLRSYPWLQLMLGVRGYSQAAPP